MAPRKIKRISTERFGPRVFEANDRPASWLPEQELLFRVLERAVADLRIASGSIAKGARRWFLSNDTRAFSFLYVCDFLALSAEGFMSTLKQAKLL